MAGWLAGWLAGSLLTPLQIEFEYMNQNTFRVSNK